MPVDRLRELNIHIVNLREQSKRPQHQLDVRNAVDASLARTIPARIPPGIETGWLGRGWEHDANGRDAVFVFRIATGKEANESDVHEVGVDSRVLVRAVIGEDVDFNLFEATEPEDFAGAELGEATVTDVVEVLKRLTADVEELDTSILEARVDVDGESALLVDNSSKLVTDLLADEHQIDKGVVSPTGMRETGDFFATDWVDGPVARWERAQPIDEDIPADLNWQLVDWRA